MNILAIKCENSSVKFQLIEISGNIFNLAKQKLKTKFSFNFFVNGSNKIRFERMKF